MQRQSRGSCASATRSAMTRTNRAEKCRSRRGEKAREVDGDDEFRVQGCGRDWSRRRRPSHGRAIWISPSTFDPHFFDIDLVYSFFF